MIEKNLTLTHPHVIVGSTTITDALANRPVVPCVRCGVDFARDAVGRKLCPDCRAASGKRYEEQPEASAVALGAISRCGAADGDDCPKRAAFIDALLERMKRR